MILMTSRNEQVKSFLEDKNRIGKLGQGEYYAVFGFSGGGYLVYRLYDVFVLFSFEKFWDEPKCCGTFNRKYPENLFETIYKNIKY